MALEYWGPTLHWAAIFFLPLLFLTVIAAKTPPAVWLFLPILWLVCVFHPWVLWILAPFAIYCGYLLWQEN